MTHIAIISNEPTPYRLHVLQRIAREIPQVHVHNIFTHSISQPSMPWTLQIDPTLNPVFFPAHHLQFANPISPTAIALYNDIKNHIQKNRIKLIVLLGYNDLARLLLIRRSHRQKIPLLLTSDSNIHADDLTPPAKRLIKKPVVKWVLRHIAGLMPMGSAGKQFFRRYLNHNLPEFLFPYEPDYAQLQNFPQEEAKNFAHKYNLNPDRRRLLFCGRLIPVKRAADAIQAFTQIAPARPDWDLILIGDGPQRHALESQIPPTLHDRIKFLGFLQTPEVIAAYHNCHILIHPAEFEPWGLVINEATACNLPIISTTVVGAAIELVHDQKNGYLIPPHNVQALTKAIDHLTTPETLTKMRPQCLPALTAWRQSADPITALRQALHHFLSI